MLFFCTFPLFLFGSPVWSIFFSSSSPDLFVVLNKGDLTEEEAKSETVKVDSDDPPPDGRIRFKKPTKRSGEDDEKKMDHTGEPNKKRGKVQKKSMLSFDEDEEDEEYS